MKKQSLKMSIVAAFFAAIISICAQITIPLPLIPITAQTFAIGLTVTILGLRYGTLSILLYILLGAIGMPVFSSMTGGLGILFGPTGGYIVGFLVQSIVMGSLFRLTRPSLFQSSWINCVGMLVSLLCGMVGLKLWGHYSFATAFYTGFVPFLFVGILKALAAGILGYRIRLRLTTSKIIQQAPFK